jgi:hypothetical protein
MSPSSACTRSSASYSVFSIIFIDEEIDGMEDKGSAGITMKDVDTYSE